MKSWPGPWVDRAPCGHVPDPDIFFPDKGGSPREAQKICKSCPVKKECREYGADERFGVWGGRHNTRPRGGRLHPVEPLAERSCIGVCGGQRFIPRSYKQKWCSDRCRVTTNYYAEKSTRTDRRAA